MNFRELIVLLPCHGLEDFPLYHEGDEAAGLLAAWTALWHPALIAGAARAPTWQRVDSPPAEVAERLFVIPPVADGRLPAGFEVRAQEEHATLVRNLTRREAIVERALAALSDVPVIDPDLVADFFALGFCRLQVELLTRQMRYSSNLDEPGFERRVVDAAAAAAKGDDVAAREQITLAFNLLNEARKYFYPVDSFLVDLTLVADSTLGPALVAELEPSVPINLLFPEALLTTAAQSQPATLAALRGALQRGNVSLVGGELAERELPLLPPEIALAEIRAGIAEYERVLGRRPVVFGRRRFGSTILLPQLLERLGFRGALHFTLDDGRFPVGMQSKVRWEFGGGAIDALAKLPRDAAKPETFLEFARKLGEAMDSDHVATIVLAHWPGCASAWYADLRRVARYTPALGKFVTLDEYFADTYAPQQTARFRADDYRTPYLQQAIVRRAENPISSLCQVHLQAAADAAQTTLSSLAALLGHRPDGLSPADPCVALARTLPRAAGAAKPAALAFNSLSAPRRMLLERPLVDELPAPSNDPAPPDHTVVEVPALGFAFVDWSAPAATPRKREKLLAEGNIVRNEFFEVTIHPAGGGIQAIHDYRQRGSRLAQQIALRIPGAAPLPGETWRDPDELAVYSRMQVESIEVTRASTLLGEIVSRGKLVDDQGSPLATFVQRTQARRGSRLLRLHIEVDPAEPLRADPWNTYFAARFAWSDATADVYRGVHLTRQPTDAKRIEAPEYIELDSAGQRTTILTGGLPYHRRSAMRIVDSLLLVRGETARSFQMGIGIDLPNPAAAALDLITPEATLRADGPPLAGAPQGWFFHVAARNVVVTALEPLPAVGADTADRGRPPGGCRLRLMETRGAATRVSVRCFCRPARAEKVDFCGAPLGAWEVAGDSVSGELAPYEWAQVDVWW